MQVMPIRLHPTLRRLFRPGLGLLLVALMLGLSRPPTTQPATALADQFEPLFNGRDLTGWHGVPHIDPRKIDAMSEAERKAQLDAWTEEARQHWRVEDGLLINDGAGPYLATDEEYEDFELRLSYRIDPGTDSGIYLRGSPQVQIWDPEDESKLRHGGDKGSGGLWNNSPGALGKDPLVRADHPAGEWNDLRVIMVDDFVTVWLNDQLVVDHARMENYFDRGNPMFERGPIILQTHGGETAWRDLAIRRIGDEEAARLLEQDGPTGEGETDPS